MQPIIDWELSKYLVGNNPETAKELLLLLQISLPKELIAIKKSYETKQYRQLKSQIHHLLGALCYCGVPRFKDVTLAIHHALTKNDKKQVTNLFSKFEHEATQVMQQLEDLLKI